MKALIFSLSMLAGIAQGYVEYTVDWSTDLSWLADTNQVNLGRTTELINGKVFVYGKSYNEKLFFALLSSQGDIITYTQFDNEYGDPSYAHNYFLPLDELANGTLLISYHSRVGSESVVYWLGVEIDEDSIEYNLLPYPNIDSIYALLREEAITRPKSNSRFYWNSENALIEKHTFRITDTPTEPTTNTPTTVTLSVHQTTDLSSGNWQVVGSIEDTQTASNGFYKLVIQP